MLDGHEFQDDETLLARSDTLRGDVRDAVLNLIKGLKKPWAKTSEIDQAQIISDADRLARRLAGDAVRLIASRGEDKFLEGQLDQFTAKDAIKATVSFSGHAQGRDFLFDGVGGRVLLVLLDDEEIMGETAAAEPEADQPALFDQTDAGEHVAAEKEELLA